MKTFKTLALIMATAIVFGLVGCSTATVAPTTAPAVQTAAPTEAPTEPATPAPQKPVKLTFSWWGSAERADATLAAIDLWNKANPAIQVEGIPLSNEGYMDKLVTQLAGGNAPDLFNTETDYLVNFSENNLIVDLTPYVSTYLKDIDPGLWSFYTNGKDTRPWAIPFGQNGNIFAYNKTMFEQLGVRLPTNNETWDSMLDLMKQMTRDTNGDGKLDFWGYHYTWFFNLNDYYAQQLGYENGYIAADLKKSIFGDPKVLEAFKKFEVARDYCPAPGVMNLRENETAISAGYVAFQGCAYSNFPAIQKSSKYELGIIAQPTLTGGKDVRTSIGGICYAVNSKCPDVEAALKFSSYFTSDAEAGKVLGAVRGILPSKPQRDAYTSILATAPDGAVATKVIDLCGFINGLGNQVPPLVRPSAFAEWQKQYEDELQLYEYKQQTLEQFFANVSTKGDALLTK